MEPYSDPYKSGMKTYELFEDSELVVKVGSMLKASMDASELIDSL